MKRFSIRFAAIFLLTLFVSSCRQEAFGIHGAGNTETEIRMLPLFNGVEIRADADVILHVDSICRIEIRGQQNVINVLSAHVSGGRLCIDFSRPVLSHSGLTIDVYAPYYTFTGISGTGNISNVDGWSTQGLEASVSGAGTIYLSSVQATDVQAYISGTGTLRLAGSCQSLKSKISGAGDLHAFDLAGTTGDVTISGSGNIEVNVTQSLDVRISGSGNVYYKNNPAVDADISGSGQLVHVQ
jgi:hypothetical protein